jgi:hypothetical protein
MALQETCILSYLKESSSKSHKMIPRTQIELGSKEKREKKTCTLALHL